MVVDPIAAAVYFPMTSPSLHAAVASPCKLQHCPVISELTAGMADILTIRNLHCLQSLSHLVVPSGVIVTLVPLGIGTLATERSIL